MKTIVKTTWIALLLACASLACGTNDKAPAAAPIALEQMPGTFRKALCKKVFACCSATERMMNPHLVGDEAACEAALDGEATFFLADLGASVAQGRLIYHADRMATCIADLEAQSCDQVKVPAGDLDITKRCKDVFEPQVPIGGACSDYWDCVGGWCVGDLGGLRDMCSPLRKVGEDCDEGPECESGLCGDERVCEKKALGSGNICAIGTEVVGQHGTASEGRGDRN